MMFKALLASLVVAGIVAVPVPKKDKDVQAFEVSPFGVVEDFAVEAEEPAKAKTVSMPEAPTLSPPMADLTAAAQNADKSAAAQVEVGGPADELRKEAEEEKRAQDKVAAATTSSGLIREVDVKPVAAVVAAAYPELPKGERVFAAGLPVAGIKGATKKIDPTLDRSKMLKKTATHSALRLLTILVACGLLFAWGGILNSYRYAAKGFLGLEKSQRTGRFTGINKEPLVYNSPDDSPAFLNTFNNKPPSARLRIVGKNEEAGMRLCGKKEDVVFDFALDLSQQVAGDGAMSANDQATVNQYLAGGKPTEVLVVKKNIQWTETGDITAQIRERLVAQGFAKEVEVSIEVDDEVRVCRSGFLSPMLSSIVAGCSMRMAKLLGSSFEVVESNYYINLKKEEYWNMVSEGLEQQQQMKAGAY